MALTKNDVILLLSEMQEEGIDTKDDVTRVIKSTTIPMDVLKRINDNRNLDVLKFYEKLRKSYNDKRSKLYINIMRADENVLDDNPKTILTTLSAMLNQILQFDAADRALFYKHSRCDEIVTVLNIYFNNFNLDPALKLLKLMKADLMALESIK